MRDGCKQCELEIEQYEMCPSLPNLCAPDGSVFGVICNVQFQRVFASRVKRTWRAFCPYRHWLWKPRAWTYIV